MDNLLANLSTLIKTKLSSSDDGSYTIVLNPSKEEKELLEILEVNNCVQQITADKKVISIKGIIGDQEISVELIKYSLTNMGIMIPWRNL